MEDYNEDEIILHMPDDSEFLMTRHNAELYTFVGNLSTRNHVFIETGEDEQEGVTTGTFIFAHGNVYNALVRFMLDHNYPMRLNQLTVQECDENAFQMSLEQLNGTEIDDHFPDDWK